MIQTAITRTAIIIWIHWWLKSGYNLETLSVHVLCCMEITKLQLIQVPLLGCRVWRT